MIRHPPSSPLFPSPPLSRSGVVERVIERPDRHVRDAHVINPVRALPADEVGEVGDRTSAYRLVAGIARLAADDGVLQIDQDRKSTRLNSSHLVISYAVFCLK